MLMSEQNQAISKWLFSFQDVIYEKLRKKRNETIEIQNANVYYSDLCIIAGENRCLLFHCRLCTFFMKRN